MTVESSPSVSRGVALVRPPGPRLAEGIVTHIDRSPVDLDAAREQHAGYVRALQANGWRTVEVPPADDCPDAVFIEDAVVVVDDLAVLTRSGAPVRRGEKPGAAAAVHDLGLRVAEILNGTLDGGDVLQVGRTVYVGQGGRTDAAGLAEFADLLAPLGRQVIGVPLREVLHLKSAITALPDGELIALTDLLDLDAVPELRGRSVRRPQEEEGAHVVALGGDRILISAAAPLTTNTLVEAGWQPVTTDIGEFEKLEGCVTCLSVLIPDESSVPD